MFFTSKPAASSYSDWTNKQKIEWAYIPKLTEFFEKRTKERLMEVGKKLCLSLLTCVITHPNEQLASAPGKIYLFMKRPLIDHKPHQQSSGCIHLKREIRKWRVSSICGREGTHQIRSSYCHWGRRPATWKRKMPSSSRRSYTCRRNAP